MGDKMRMLPFREILGRMKEEVIQENSLFGLPSDTIFRKKNQNSIAVCNERCDTVMGPAAGPHTQITQNIIISYLSGSRFIELKTVQIMDTLEIEKPCIDAYDEGFNTEWSTELTLEQAWREYAKAWIILHYLEKVLDLNPLSLTRSFIFNMSVGYDLKGIKNERMQQYLNRMMDSGAEPLFKQWLNELETMIGEGLCEAFGKPKGYSKGLTESISPEICKSITLSTMHGCPPDEIEAICRYMLSEKNIDTYVKLNPTLLGFDFVRNTLDGLGYKYVGLKQESFDHDLQYPDALGILNRLRALASECKRNFGVKLTNTLGSINNLQKLPGDEMYMSGRALFPLSINLAARLSREFDGTLPISYSGGINQQNVVDVFKTGIRPVTVATDLLKPGGYQRMTVMADMLETVEGWDRQVIDVESLETLAESALHNRILEKEYRGKDEVVTAGALPVFDCYVAPCITACAINQNIPEYIRLAGEGKYAESLALIYERNALPSITGHICDHQCQLHCSRLDYEGCLGIREVKRLAVKYGLEEFTAKYAYPSEKSDKKVAVIGAGPAGLASAYFLAREGFSVKVFEREANAGGVVANVVPHFRITREAIASDVNFIKSFGVEFEFGCDPELTSSALEKMGFTYTCLGIGAYATKDYKLEGGDGKTMPSLTFLTQFNKDPSVFKLGKKVAVMGAGDTAMDTARAALRCPGVEEAFIVYRRSFDEMPASKEEYLYAVDDGITFNFLRNPQKMEEGKLVCEVMELGEPDSSGRRRPVATGKTESIEADFLLYAIGDSADHGVLEKYGVTPASGGWVETSDELETSQGNVFLMGDGRTGPSTIIKCIAEGRLAADAICRRENADWQRNSSMPEWEKDSRLSELKSERGIILEQESKEAEEDRLFLETERKRCLECNYFCNKCVDVCPNRANIAVKSPQGYKDAYQIIHLDAYCNECGNCGHFCPWEGRPYTDKQTIFSKKEDFENSENPGWFVEGETLYFRYGNRTDKMKLKNGKAGDRVSFADPRFFDMFDFMFKTRPGLFGKVEDEA